MKSAEVERAAIVVGAGFGLYYGFRTGKHLIYFIILIWIAWGLMVSNAWNGPVLIPEKWFDKAEDPAVVGHLQP